MTSMKSVTTVFAALVLGASSLATQATPHHHSDTYGHTHQQSPNYSVIPNPKPHYIKHKPSYQLDINLKGFKKRIKHGVKTGELTHSEVKFLKKRLRHLRQAIKGAKADHYISYEEKNRLERKAKRLSRAIYNKKHNDEKRYEQHYHHY